MRLSGAQPSIAAFAASFRLHAAWRLRHRSGMKSTSTRPGLSAGNPAAVLRRAYFDCRFGQLHVHQAIAPGGGFDERTTLLCLPAPGESAAVFQPVLAQFGQDRSVFAVDPPGAGQSDGADGPAPAVLAAAVLDFLHNMRIRKAHVLADAGAVGSLALLLPEASGLITRVVLCGARADALPAQGALVRTVLLSAPELAADNDGARVAVRQLREFFDAEER